MAIARLQDRVSRGFGTAARRLGYEYDAYRTAHPTAPIAPPNRFLRLHAAFTDENATFHRPVLYGHAAWSGIFDTAYTKPGDYLRGPEGTFFIAAQRPRSPRFVS